MKYRG